MKNTKFSFNSLIVVLIAISAIGFLFTVKLVNMADRIPVNEVYNIEGTDLSIRYSNLDKNGIYKGGENTGSLMLEGTFGVEWGAVREGETLYANEFKSTDLGLVLCDVVKIDLNSFKKETLYTNSVLRGRNKSGEIIIIKNCVMPSNSPMTNSLMKLYTLSAKDIKSDGSKSEILFINAESGDTVYSIKDNNAFNKFEDKYGEKTLEEVRE